MVFVLFIVFFYNYGWQDYSFGTMVGMADVVRVMQFELSKGKVAIHCHAGLGSLLYSVYLLVAGKVWNIYLIADDGRGTKAFSVSVCLSVCLHYNSKMNDTKVLELDAGNDLRISYK